MKNKKTKEILIEFENTNNPKQLDNMLCEFENNINTLNMDYYMKESENPYIYFIEYNKPKKLIHKLKMNQCLEKIIQITPVESVLTNTNHIASVITQKIRNKITGFETYKINCFMDSFNIQYTKEELTEDIKNQITQKTGMIHQEYDPNWLINIHVIGSITAIDIKKVKRCEDCYLT